MFMTASMIKINGRFFPATQSNGKRYILTFTHWILWAFFRDLRDSTIYERTVPDTDGRIKLSFEGSLITNGHVLFKTRMKTNKSVQSNMLLLTLQNLKADTYNVSINSHHPKWTVF